ncbi:MAG: rhomboid family intramembrane serine protease [Planctomycetes bacterium]|jgi:membrane associated rhomboid family serine protease|nr:rhomboid family intramembrane serine protease [Planctomycetota bacterium]MBT4029707.1 rhomboid family intramembrane serine protease [Planctomycetota bacterium]MBT4561207.1 rhomboid family intramembrane serine protease [Planctomycetota bacterium]MBT5101336.1 rhomboid family intramembrane serine protease [Planctomycetota bacterium]MBT5120772.1 rhomboid family intramembrane serine protease [Planctomycetota bacterium]
MPSLTPTVRNILILWVGLWLISYLSWIGDLPMAEYLSFNPRALASGEFRGFLGMFTYGFVHERGVFHLLFNAWMFALFAPEAERLLGVLRFRYFLFAALLGGSLFHFLLGFISPAFATQVLGGSGMAMAVLALNAAAMPHLSLRLLVIDVPLRTFFFVVAGIDVLQLMATFAGKNIAVASDVHLVGAALGYFSLRYFRPTFVSRARSGSLIARLQRAFANWMHRRNQSLSVQEEAELDRILSKIHTEGMPSLTAKERRFLERRSKRPPR